MKIKHLPVRADMGAQHYGKDYHWGWNETLEAGLRSYSIKSELECLVLSGQGSLRLPQGKTIPLQPGTLLVGEGEEELQLRLDTPVELHLLYPSEQYRKKMRQFMGSLPPLGADRPGRFVEISRTTQGGSPKILIYSVGAGPVLGRINQIGLHCHFIDLWDELCYRIDGPACARRRLFDWFVTLPRAFRENLVVEKGDKCWLWKPCSDGISLMQALKDKGFSCRIGATSPDVEAACSHILEHWRHQGVWSAYDCDALGVSVAQVGWNFSDDFRAQHGPVIGPRLPKGYFGPRLIITPPQPGQALDWEFFAGHLYEKWSVPWRDGWDFNRTELLHYAD